MEELIGRIISKYGTPMEVQKDGKWATFRAFLQPFTTKAKQNMLKEVSPLGEIPGGQYVFIGPVDAVAEGDTLRLKGEKYLVRRLDKVYYTDQAVYCWGLCSRKGEEDTWGM